MPSPSASSVRHFKTALLVAAFMNCLAPSLSGQAPPTIATAQRVPVLVELFTSEGCSDCPPADALLARLDATQPISGVQAIVLSEHVTYWNHLGWSDPFSFDAMSQRQEEYSRQFGLDSNYTPQMIVDGTEQFVGSDGRALVAAMTKQAKSPKKSLAIASAKWDHGSVRFSVLAEAPARTKLVAVLASDATHSEVARGENAGRTLHHTAVVRVIKEFGGNQADGRELLLSDGPPKQKSEASSPVRLIVFLADSKTGHVLGAAEQTLQP
jgi:hypothetical protein